MSVIIGKWRRTSWGWDLLEMKGMICETINRQEIISALREVKCGKAAEVEEIAEEFLSKGGEAMVEELKRIFNVCINVAKVPRVDGRVITERVMETTENQVRDEQSGFKS